MFYFFTIIFGVLPSIIWLLFYLRKDVHPESNSMIIKVFFYGALFVLPTIFLELGAWEFFNLFSLPPLLLSILNVFLGVALIEEVMKFLVVKTKVLSNAEFDEPIDAPLYMIISALGFAAFENIAILFGLNSPFLLLQTIRVSALRFLGATFLHTLCSGTIGCFLAISLLETKKKRRLIFLGLSISTFLHGLYNFSIMELDFPFSFRIPLAILIGLAIFLIFAFKKLKNMQSVCKIE